MRLRWAKAIAPATSTAKAKTLRSPLKRIKSTTLKPLCGSVGAIWVPFWCHQQLEARYSPGPLESDKINGSSQRQRKLHQINFCIFHKFLVNHFAAFN